MSTHHDDPNPYASPREAFDVVAAFGSRETLLSVARGLNLVYWGIAITLLTVMAGVVGGAALAPTLENVRRLTLAISAGVLLGALVGMAGRIICLRVPEETRARPLIFAAVTLDVVAICIRFIAQWQGSPNLESVSNLAQLGASVMFVLFLQRVANFIQEPDLAAKARSLITLGILAAVLGIVTIAGAVAQISLAALAGLAMVVVVLFAFLRYVRLLHDLRLAILQPTAAA